MMGQKEIFSLLAIGLIDNIPQGQLFDKAVLNIMRQPAMVEFKSHIIDNSQEKIDLEVSMGYKYAKAILELYQLTQTQAPFHTDWNRAVFTLYPNSTSEMEYIWDKELQQEVDGYNEKNIS